MNLIGKFALWVIVVSLLSISGRSSHNSSLLSHLKDLCYVSDNKEFLYNTLVSYFPYNTSVQRPFLLITSSTRNILSYSSYSLFINGVFSVLHDIGYKIYDEDAYKQKEKLDEDSRWNKVKYLMDEVRKNLHSSTVEWIAWVDADLAIIDFNFNITSLISNYSDAEVIMSRDKATAPFVANSGFIIVKVSHWSLNFLELWWDTYSRETCCDQNALTWLYQRNLPNNVSTYLVLLDADAINTNFPARENHHVGCPVLHLAGLSSVYRTLVLSHGFSQLCTTLLNESFSFPDQLSLNKQNLQRFLLELNDHRLIALRELLVLADTTFGITPKAISGDSGRYQFSHLIDVHDRAFSLKTSIDDVLKYEDDEAVWVEKYFSDRNLNISVEREKEKDILLMTALLRCKIYQSSLRYISFLEDEITIYCMKIENVQCLPRLNLLQNVLTFGFEYLVSLKALYEQHLQVNHFPLTYREILMYLRDLIMFTSQFTEGKNEKIEAVFYYYLFKHNHFLLSFITLEYPPQSLLSSDLFEIQLERNLIFEESLHIWKILVEKYHFYGTNYVLADPEKEYIETLFQYGTELCFQKNYTFGLSHIITSIEKQKEMISGYGNIYITTSTVIQNAKIRLGQMYYNYGLCLFASNHFAKAKDYLFLSLEIFDERDTLYQQSVSLIKQAEDLILHPEPEVISPAMKVSTRTVRLKKKKKKN